MPTQTTQQEQQRYHCRIYGDNRTIEQARSCIDYCNTSCKIYKHVCSVWDAFDRESRAQSLRKGKLVQEALFGNELVEEHMLRDHIQIEHLGGLLGPGS